MYLGVDVGGTHTDAVLLDTGFKTIKSSKAVTLEKIDQTLKVLLSDLLDGQKAADVRRITVSTTLGLNSVLTDTADPVGILMTGGPGILPNPADWGSLSRLLSGAQDHRGVIISAQDPLEVKNKARELEKAGAHSLVVASKFGPKNPELENSILLAAQTVFKGSIISAAKLFGGLGFPRRLAGTILNAAIARLYGDFLASLTLAFKEAGLVCDISILKSDGGIMDLKTAQEQPVLALAAGPAASLLGLWSLTESSNEDILMLDMGGTTTDLALLSRGHPLLTARGLTLAGRPTLVRGLLTHSLALGGDSCLILTEGKLGPTAKRRGPAIALCPEDLGQREPTLTDAFNVLGLCTVGDTKVSTLALEKIFPQGAREGAQMAVEAALDKLKLAVDSFVAEVNQQPVYTISEFLVDWKLEPKKCVVLGGPAFTLAPLLTEKLQMPTLAPAEAATVNAQGAALARATVEAELYADTSQGTVSIPTLGFSRQIGRDYNLEEAKSELLSLLADPRSRIISAESFNQLSDYGRSGKVIRVRAQSEPGLINRPD